MMAITGCSLEEAIGMASRVPAGLNRLTDRGGIEPGKRADLILFRVGKGELEICKTFVAGQEVYCADEA